MIAEPTDRIDASTVRLLQRARPNWQVISFAGDTTALMRSFAYHDVDVLLIDGGLMFSEHSGWLSILAGGMDVIVLSDDPCQAMLAFEIGATDFVLKPVGAMRLDQAIERVDTRRRERQAVGAAERASHTRGTSSEVDGLRGIIDRLENQLLRSPSAALRETSSGLHVRQALNQRVREECSRAHRFSQSLCLVVFAPVAEVGALEVTDDLSQISRAVCRCCRLHDFPARISEQAVGVLLPMSSVHGAKTYIQRVLAAWAEQSSLDGRGRKRLVRTVLCQLAPGETPGEFIRRAEQRLLDEAPGDIWG